MRHLLVGCVVMVGLSTGCMRRPGFRLGKLTSPLQHMAQLSRVMLTGAARGPALAPAPPAGGVVMGPSDRTRTPTAAARRPAAATVVATGEPRRSEPPGRATQFSARYTDSAGNAVCEPFESGGVCNRHCTSVLQTGAARDGCSCLEAVPCS